MSGLVEIAEAMLSSSQKRLEVASQNITNSRTSGYKSSIAFEEIVSGGGQAGAATPTLTSYVNLAQGALTNTGNPLDLALSDSGFFLLQGVERSYYSRAGQFQIATDGRVVDPNGMALQTIDGADLILRSDNVEILADGTVLEDGLPVSRIGVFEPGETGEIEALGGTLFRVSGDVMNLSENPTVRQGMLEASNVDWAGETLAVMAAQRGFEAGARFIQSYDAMMSEALSTFGRAQR